MGLLVACISMAATFDVNKTSILVSDTVANDPLKIKQAFAQIIANNSGENIVDVLRNPVFIGTNISQGIKRSYFEKVEAKYLAENGSPKFWFHVVADESFVQDLINEAGFSLLPHNRENVLLWLVKEEVESEVSDFSNQDARDEARASLSPKLTYGFNDEISMYWIKHWAQALGVALITPSMDEQDMLVVTPESIKNLSFQAYEQTRNRYDMNYALLVYIKRTEGDIKIRSGFVMNQNDMSIKHFQEQMINNSPTEEGELYYSVIHDVVEKYSNIFKIDRSDLEKHMVRLVVDKLDNYDQVYQVRKYFNKLSVIESFEIVAASSGKLELNVNLSVTTAALLKIISNENVLNYNNNSPINQLIFSIIKPEQ